MEKNIFLENLKYLGWSKTDIFITNKEIDFLKKNVTEGFDYVYKKYKKEDLIFWNHQDILKCMFKFEPEWIEFISSNWLNEIVNISLNDVAILYDVFGLNNTGEFSSNRASFHRDQLYLGRLRASVLIIIPLVDFTKENGATEIVPGSHLIEEKPSQEFLEKNSLSLTGKSGEIIVLDASVWHRAGLNLTKKERPSIIIRYQLPFLKRNIDLCSVYEKELINASDLLKQRFGWNCRENTEIEDCYSEIKKFSLGQYQTKGLYNV